METSSNSGYRFYLPDDLTTPHMHLALFFIDYVGNVSEPYYLCNTNANQGSNTYTWWIVEKTLTADDISIVVDKAWNNYGTYTATVSIPVGIIVTKVELSSNYGQDVKVNFAGYQKYDNKNLDWNGSSNAYINVAAESSMTISMTLWNGNGAKIKINGIEKSIFGQ